MDGLELTWRLKQRYEKKKRLKKKGRFGDQNLDLLCSQCSLSSSFFLGGVTVSIIHFPPFPQHPCRTVYFTYIYHKHQLNVGKCIIHGWYGIVMNEFESNWTLDHPLEVPRSSMVTDFFSRVRFGWEDSFCMPRCPSALYVRFLNFKSYMTYTIIHHPSSIIHHHFPTFPTHMRSVQSAGRLFY